MALTLSQKIVRLHEALADARIPHAFGGALALAYCTHDPRGTNDIDVNLFVRINRARSVLDRLPPGIVVDGSDLERIHKDGQSRLWWDGSPVDVFFSNHPFHDEARKRVQTVPFADSEIPVLGCTDLVVFKTLYGRGKDLVDIENMHEAGTVDAQAALASVEGLLGRDHPHGVALARILGQG